MNNKGLTPNQRLNRVCQLLLKGIYLYTEKYRDEIHGTEKSTAGLVSGENDNLREMTQAAKSTDNIEKYLKTQDIMRIFRISRTTLWRLRKKNELPFYLFGNNSIIRYRVSDIIDGNIECI